jgi:hypothetical protein
MFEPVVRADELLERITSFYLESSDFNGISIRALSGIISDTDNLRASLAALIQNGEISLVFGDTHPNPHILAIEPDTVSAQIEKLTSKLFDQACAYPMRQILETRVNKNDYVGRPFTLDLALGAPQLSPRFFDLEILESYRNEPRYWYSANSSEGTIYTKQQNNSNSFLRESDQVILSSFGFGHNKDITCRVVVCFPRYLGYLTPEHQQIWHAKQLIGEYQVHPNYQLTTAGHFPINICIFEAFALELGHINKLCALMGKPPLFRCDFNNHDRPSNLSFLLRPTTKEFFDFILTLDKILSDNIQMDFFRFDERLKADTSRKGRKTGKIQKGTLQLLNEWISAHFEIKDPQPLEQMMSSLRYIRTLRQSPAHRLVDNIFDPGLFGKQRDIIISTYSAIRTLRLIFQTHPDAIDYRVEPELDKSLIWTF